MVRASAAVPQLAVVAPLAAFAAGGTAVPIDPTAELTLWLASFPVLASVAWSLWRDTRHARTVSGIAMVVWWAAFLVSLIVVSNPRTSAFGVLTVAAVPVVIAFTWGQLWGVRDIEETDRT